MKKTKTAKTENKKENKPNIEKEIISTLSELLTKLNVEAEIAVTKGEEDHYKADIKTQDTGLLIGRHGETINSLQLVLGIMLYKKLKSWARVVVDVGDYRRDREINIKEMVERIILEVKNTGQPVILPYLTPYERRIVHMMLAENKEVASDSQGEGKDRRITIRLRQSS